MNVSLNTRCSPTPVSVIRQSVLRTIAADGHFSSPVASDHCEKGGREVPGGRAGFKVPAPVPPQYARSTCKERLDVSLSESTNAEAGKPCKG
jgi:hypothetical protein